jgi:hypothetical protein
MRLRQKHPAPPFYLKLTPNPRQSKPHSPFRHCIAERVSSDGTEYSLHATKGYRRKRPT